MAETIALDACAVGMSFPSVILKNSREPGGSEANA
jgi:hypothetical protein